MIGNTYWPSTVVAIAAASEIASTANGQRRRDQQWQRCGEPEPQPGEDPVLLNPARQRGAHDWHADRHRDRHVDHAG